MVDVGDAKANVLAADDKFDAYYDVGDGDAGANDAEASSFTTPAAANA